MSSAVRSRALPVLVLSSAIALGAVIAVGSASTPRTLLTCWFLLACPGLGLAPLVRLDDAVGTWTVAVALSVSIDIVVAGGLMYAGWWSPLTIFVVLAIIAGSGALIQLAMSREGRG
ncbi:MAG: hypothetical protein JWO02_2706 [Solirubrobacterales bacterium]|nr:hypothetical protein [Solirubrobacterales bacterium]